MRRRLNLLLFLFLKILPATGQELPHIINFDRSSYGAQNQNWSIAQAPDGSIYFANNAGLLEFDGARWRSFQLPDRQVVRAVAYQNERVFVGGFAEFGYFEPDPMTKWRYHSLSLNLNSDLVRKEEIWHILATPDAVYFQSFSSIYKFDGKQVEQVETPSNLMFLQEAREQLVFQGISRGLYELLPDGGFRLLDGSQALANFIVAFILPGKGGDLFVGTKNNGVFICKNGACRPWANPLNEYLKAHQLNKAALLPDGGLALGTVLDGVFLLDSLENLRYHLNQENGLQDNTILSMFADCSGNLWLGLDKGIDLLELNSPLTFFNDRSGKVGAVFTAALFEGKLFIGTNHGVFQKPWRLEPGNTPFELVPGTQGQVWELQTLGDQLLCGHNEGSFLIKNNRATKISDVTGGWTTQPVPGNPSAMIQGTYTGLIVFLKNQLGEWAFSHRVEGFLEPVKQIQFDANGSLWLAHPNRGIWRVRLSEDLRRIVEIRQFTTADGLPSVFKPRLLDWNGQICAQLDTAFFRVDNDHLVEMTHPFLGEGKVFALPNGESYSVLPAAVIDFSTGLEQGWTLPLTLVPGYENIVSLTQDIQLFCLENGFALLNKKQVPTSKQNCDFALKISAVEILTNPPQWFYPGKETKRMELLAGHNNIRIYRTGGSLAQISDACWVRNGNVLNCGKTDAIELTGLSSGTHLIKLESSNGAVSENFGIYIRPPWWRAWWALLLWFICLIGVFFLVENYNRKRLAKQLALLQKEKERELAAERMAAERQRLQSEVDNKNRELSNATLNLIRKNEALLSLKSELEKTELPQKESDRIDRHIEAHLSGDKDWELFEAAFNQVHDAFFKKLKNQYPELTTGDLRLAAFLKLNLSSKEIASLLGLSVRGVENKRYRLRKKMALNEADNLTEVLMSI
ncbi:MAG: hypothetical protein GC192_09015 [Bacteroidetes bacterium]|nr:hypothetical protein [Bacteroidota bacterium]